MAKILVVYYSRTGNTAQMAEAVAEGAGKAGAQVEVKEAGQATPDDLLEADGIIVGSPTYYGLPAAEIKQLLDESVKYHGKMSGKVGGAFASVGGLGGGSETTVLGIIQMLLIHGMIVQGNAEGSHYGPVSIGKPNDRALEECRALGERVANLADALK